MNKTFFSIMAFNLAFPMASRSALKTLSGSLNFSIAGALNRVVREERNRRPDGAGNGDGATGPDGVTQATGDAQERANDRQHQEDNGHTVEQPALETAGYLKSVRDWVAAQLEAHAQIKTDPMTGKEAPDTFHLATDMQQSLDFRANGKARIDMKAVRALADTTGADESAVIAKMQSDNERQNKFAQRDNGRVYELYLEVQAKGQDGHVLESEAAFDRLPAIYQERLLAAADKACWTAVNNAAAEALSGQRKDALGDCAHLNEVRWDLRAAFKNLQKDPRFKRELAEQYNTARQPIWAPEPRLKTAAAAA